MASFLVKDLFPRPLPCPLVGGGVPEEEGGRVRGGSCLFGDAWGVRTGGTLSSSAVLSLSSVPEPFRKRVLGGDVGGGVIGGGVLGGGGGCCKFPPPL